MPSSALAVNSFLPRDRRDSFARGWLAGGTLLAPETSLPSGRAAESLRGLFASGAGAHHLPERFDAKTTLRPSGEYCGSVW